MDAILNYSFLPNIWNVYHSFFNILWVAYKDEETKFGDRRLHIGPPQPQDYWWETRDPATVGPN